MPYFRTPVLCTRRRRRAFWRDPICAGLCEWVQIRRSHRATRIHLCYRTTVLYGMRFGCDVFVVARQKKCHNKFWSARTRRTICIYIYISYTYMYHIVKHSTRMLAARNTHIIPCRPIKNLTIPNSKPELHKCKSALARFHSHSQRQNQRRGRAHCSLLVSTAVAIAVHASISTTAYSHTYTSHEHGMS